MSKLLSILVAAVFAVSTGSVFAASHMKAAPDAKAGEMKKDEMKKETKSEMKKSAKKAPKAKKTAKPAEEKK